MYIKLSYSNFDLQFNHSFTVSGFSRSSTPIVIIQLEFEGMVGYGESTMPPYLGETQNSVNQFLKKIDLSSFSDPYDIESILAYVDSIEIGNNAAKAGFDIALHDLVCKLKGQTISDYYGIKRTHPLSSFTIGIDTPDIMVSKVQEGIELGFKVLKIKLGADHDHEIMRRIRKIWNGPFSIDANQGWKSKEQSLDFIFELQEMGASFIEQPFNKDDHDSSCWLTERSPLPIVADESVKRLSDLPRISNCFHGINIKLMKSTGLSEAFKMIKEARKLNMKVVTGCMAESSCAVTAMANFSPLADWVDLDGPFLIKNDPFKGVYLEEGKLCIPPGNGIGITFIS